MCIPIRKCISHSPCRILTNLLMPIVKEPIQKRFIFPQNTMSCKLLSCRGGLIHYWERVINPCPIDIVPLQPCQPYVILVTHKGDAPHFAFGLDRFNPSFDRNWSYWLCNGSIEQDSINRVSELLKSC